ncbi:hypothetical protein PMPD1_2811 [Paramixta manurensis]|uniref:Uncharacterized protein n=1 Tax=Paramixta manurensis TaxID=2740817 RepID=A0A6M8UAK5_9GAMM|nr:hypothetical protein PMPD1_2811 [Erwiniaceae bacterium PD-1]
MGQFINFAPAHAGTRLRDDYGAAAGWFLSPVYTAVTPLLSLYRTARSFPVVQPEKVVAMGGLSHVA